VAVARVVPEDPYGGLAEREAPPADAGPLDLDDPAEPDAAALLARAAAAEEAALAVPGVTNSEGAEAGFGRTEVVLVTSQGFAGRYVRSSHSLSATALAGSGTAMQRDYDYSTAVHLADLDDAAEIGHSAGERAVLRMNPTRPRTARVPVVFDPRVASSLVGHFASAINGASVARGTTFLKDRMGERVFGPGITIHDDPRRRRGLRSRPFDAEGIAGRKQNLVEDGVLKTWVLDCATARELGMTSTGHASRGVSSTPSPGATNLHLEPGTQSPEQLIADIADGFYVNDMIGMGVNLVTGDYSRGAAGFWIENGKITYPVSEVTIAGHLTDIFRSLTPANDLTFRYGTNAPTLRVEGLTVAGH
jgi:PmbA protein